MKDQTSRSAGLFRRSPDRTGVRGDFWPAVHLLRCAAWTVTTVLLLGTGAVWLRLFAGAFRRPLDWPGHILVALGVSAAAAVVRLAWQRDWESRFAGSPLPRVHPMHRSAQVAVSVAVLACGLALSLVGAPAGRLIVLWIILAGEELWAWSGMIRPGRPIAPPNRPAKIESPTLPSAVPSTPIPVGEVIQQLVRSRLADGSEQLAGWLRVALDVGQRSASVHVAFCPPFAQCPQLSVKQHEGPAARIKEAQLLPYGVRLDLRLSQAADAPVSVLLEFTARSDARIGSTRPQQPVDIALAVVRHAGQVLIGQRPEGAVLAGFWEFPGGKVQSGESIEQAAARECREETGLEIQVGAMLSTIDHEYEHGRVRLHFFTAEPCDPARTATGGFRWVPLAELSQYRFPPANAGVIRSLGEISSGQPG